MPVQHWLEKLTKASELAEVLVQINSGAHRIVLTGITPSAKPAFLAAFHYLLKKPLLYVGRDGTNFDSLHSATAFYHAGISGRDEKTLSVFPAMEPDAFSGLSPHAEVLEERALTFWRLFQAKLDILFCPLSAALNRIPDLHRTFASVPRLTMGVEYSPETLVKFLLTAGYIQEEPVTSHGSFSLRGGILDVFPPDSENPCRIEFFGDAIESLREFSVKSQRSIGPIKEISFVPMRETLLDAHIIKKWGELAEICFDPTTYEEFFKNQAVNALNGEYFQGIEYLLPLAQPFDHTLLDFATDFCLVVDEPSALYTDFEHRKLKTEKDREALRSRGIPCLRPEELFVDFQDLWRSRSESPLVVLDQLGVFQETSPISNIHGIEEAVQGTHSARQSQSELSYGGYDDVGIRSEINETGALGASLPERLPFHSNTGGYTRIDCESRPSRRFHGNLKELVQEVNRYLQQRAYLVFVQSTLGKAERLYDILKEYDLEAHPLFRAQKKDPGFEGNKSELPILIVVGEVYEGFELKSEDLIVFGEADIFDEEELLARPLRSKQKSTTFISNLRELRPCDYVVHIDHGIGQFLGLRQITADGTSREFMVISYLGDDKIYVPLERMDLVQKYSSAEGARPQLDKLGGATWTKTKSRAKKSMRDMADELLKLYAQRRILPGFSFSPQGHWHEEFEEAFEFIETLDQASAIRDVYKDMESAIPMDRLLCGDVGFGKTEVAMRAAFKAVFDGRQVVVLAPTTVLVYQHYLRFKQRFNAFPMNIEMLSRFRTPRIQDEIVQKLALGQIDILIGTHRLLSKDVQFRDLGLLIVDEEQQFGVIHKERLKQLKKNVDTLTMTATPIPRTLHMSLMGMRDMSIIETAPRDRLAINTFVVSFNKKLIQTAIEQELNRAGQVYFVHNRVQSIYAVAAMIQKLCPDARVLVGHGQMGEKELEGTMLKFVKHEADVLVSTTIIENGLDIPLVNTLIVNRADRLGLAQLYQLRGRVGRSNRKAYAYLLTPPEKALSGVARQRLAALREFSELGSGFKIAALDLELRGAGNLLGGEQHGHINAIGFDLYCQILERTIQELQGGEVLPEIQTQINLKVSVKIPTEYISDEQQRLSIYKRISSLKQESEMDELLRELEDRYGTVPKEVMSLIEFVRLRLVAQRALVHTIDRERDSISIKFHEKTPVPAQRVVEVVSSHPSISVTPSGALKMQTAGLINAEILPTVRSLLLDLLP